MRKITFFGALALSLSCSLASAQPALPPTKTDAQQLFDKCRAAYAGLKTYRGTVKTESIVQSEGVERHAVGSATVTFQQPDSLRIDGKLVDMDSNSNFSVLGNSAGAYYRWPIQNKGEWQQTTNLDEAVAAMARVFGDKTHTFADLLLPNSGGDPFYPYSNAKIEGDQIIDGQVCTKITARPDTKTISWWINKKNFLLRRIVESYDEKQSAQIMDEMNKHMGVEMRLFSQTKNFEVETINGVVNVRLFSIRDSLWPYRGQK